MRTALAQKFSSFFFSPRREGIQLFWGLDVKFTERDWLWDILHSWIRWVYNSTAWSTNLLSTWCYQWQKGITDMLIIYRLMTAYLLLRVNLDKIMHARWDFDASSARTRRVSALDKHQNWSASALFCLNSRAQSEYAVVNLIHTRRKQTVLSFIMW